MERESLTLLEIRSLMSECLAYEGDDLDSGGRNFKKYEYRGSQCDLFRLMESLAIKNDLIPNNIPVRSAAWGGSGMMLHPKTTTNFNSKEINHIYEAFHVLLNMGVVSPGAVGNMGPNLPYFHVTEYGLRCLNSSEILPYDVDGYLTSLNNIQGLNEWVSYYIKQSLMCYNANCYEASLIMVGLANEVIAESLITGYCDYLDNKHPGEKEHFEAIINAERSISRKYLKYRDHLKTFSMRRDSDLRSLNIHLDELANDTFLSYLRLTRNELAHPTALHIEKITALMIFISMIKYCERQYKFIRYYSTCI